MRRRDVLKSALAGATALAAPNIVAAEAQRVLKFLPQADLATLDPVWTTADVTRNHAHLVFDTLYGQDNNFQPHPQMASGHTVSADGRQWDITLREGLKFHDGNPVLARDCVASIQRWWQRDGFGGVLRAATDDVSAPSDKQIRFRLKKPFPLLADALAVTTSMCCIMPERLALTDPMKQVTEMVGSGPYRFIASERVAGSRVVYEKFADYVPRKDGPAEMTSGPKTVHFDRVEWDVVPDPATKAAAMRADEFDWWENPTIDLLSTLKGQADLTTVVKDHAGSIGVMRFNCLYPPFDSAAIRRIVLKAIDQREFMEAVAGAAPELIKTGIGLFVPGTPLASDVGVSMMQGPKDPAKLKAELAAAGYKGEKVVLLAASDFPVISALGAGRRRPAEEDRLQRRLPVARLGHRGAAAREPRADRQGWVERLLHLWRRHRQRIAGVTDGDPLRPGHGLVRLAERSQDGGVAARLVRRAQPRGAAEALLRDAGGAVR